MTDLFVAKLHNVSKLDLYKLFTKFGPVTDVSMPLEKDGTSKHYAFVDMINPQDAKLAMEESGGMLLNGRPIKVEYAGKGQKKDQKVIGKRFINEICQYHLYGHCRKGDHCDFRHDEDELTAATKEVELPYACYDFQRGNCHRANCRFSHDATLANELVEDIANNRVTPDGRFSRGGRTDSRTKRVVRSRSRD